MRRRVLGWMLAGVVLLGAAGIYTVARTLREPGEIAMLRDSLQSLRAAADSCRVVLDDGQAGLHAYNARLDSLRERVRELESHDPRGVPADSYPIYMRIVAQYNDSAGAWGEHVASLQQELASCRALTEAHNDAALSLRRLLIERERR